MKMKRSSDKKERSDSPKISLTKMRKNSQIYQIHIFQKVDI